MGKTVEFALQMSNHSNASIAESIDLEKQKQKQFTVEAFNFAGTKL